MGLMWLNLIGQPFHFPLELFNKLINEYKVSELFKSYIFQIYVNNRYSSYKTSNVIFFNFLINKKNEKSI